MSYFGTPLYPASLPDQTSVVSIVGTTTLAAGASTYGKTYVITGAGGYAITLPAIDGVNWPSKTFTIFNNSSALCTVATAGSDTALLLGSAYSSMSILPGERFIVQNVVTNWVIGLDSASRTTTAPLGDSTIRTASTAFVQQNLIAVVGNMRNAKMSVTAAAATGTWSADELIVETALGGQVYKLSNLSLSVNLGTTGAGGMDTGTAPVSGYVALYCIYNPTTSTVNLLATNAATLQGNVYGGANMPSGYTASALVAVWPTNASRQFITGYQNDRRFTCALVSVSNGNTVVSSPASLSISGAAPLNARSARFYLNSQSTGSTTSIGASIWSSATLGQQLVQIFGPAGTVQCVGTVNVDIITPQTVYYTTIGTGGTTYTYTIAVSGYEI